MHLSKLLPLACLAAWGTMIASADTVGPVVSTGGAAGDYTYVFDMPNGSSYTIYTTGGPIGGSTSEGNGYTYVGSPDPGYSFAVQVGTGDYNSDGVFDVEILLQYNSTTNGYGQTLDYYFTEPLSFWENLGLQTFTPNPTGTDGNYLTDGVTNVTGYSESNGYSFVYGDVYEGATYNYFNNDTADPGCTTCTVTTTFVPAIAATPEPSSLVLLSTGTVAAAFGALRRRRRSLQHV